jgi:hypothetical protein
VNAMQERKKIIRTYNLSWKEIKRKLGLKGELKTIELAAGRSPNQMEKGESADVETYEFKTEEIVSGETNETGN